MKILFAAIVFHLSLTVQAFAAISCSMSVSSVNFGSIDVTSGSAVSTSGTLSLNCTGAATVNPNRMCVDIDGGSSSDATSRIMLSGGNQLRYQLYSDSGLTTQWGSWSQGLYGGGATWDVSCASTTCSATLPVYGNVLASQNSTPSGSYLSTLNLFFTYNKNTNTSCPNNGLGNSTTSFSALATVQKTCTISATNLNFGTVGLLVSNVDASNTVTVKCSNSTSYNIGLNAGSGSGATVAARKMTNGANAVTYSLYNTAGRTTVWGNTIGTDTVTGTGSGSNQVLTVYGRVPPQTTPPPATYTDTIVVTVTY